MQRINYAVQINKHCRGGYTRREGRHILAASLLGKTIALPCICYAAEHQPDSQTGNHPAVDDGIRPAYTLKGIGDDDEIDDVSEI